MKIIADENIPFVKNAFSHLGQVKTMPGRTILNKDLLNAQILLVRSITRVDKQLLQGTPIKLVATATSGINHIDLEYLRSKDIMFTDAVGCNANSVAQYVISAICYWSLKYNKPLCEQSLGIIGYGKVGKAVKKLAHLLNIECVINDPPLAEIGTNDLSSLESSLDCNIVTVHVPYTTSGTHPTINLFNKDNINQLPSDCLFINSSRGEVVNEPALIARKDIKIVLDVWQNEPSINHLTLAQTLIGTPHIAGYSYDAKVKGTKMIHDSCCQLLNIPSKWTPPDIVNKCNQEKTISFSNNKNLREQLLKAYNISLDDSLLKKTLSNQVTKSANYFDNLRKNYPIRREWRSV